MWRCIGSHPGSEDVVMSGATKVEAVGHEPAGHSAAQDIQWEDFRDHLATAEKDGSRRWLYPRKPSGRITQYRTWFSWMLLVVMFTGPFIRIQGNPLLLAFGGLGLVQLLAVAWGRGDRCAAAAALVPAQVAHAVMASVLDCGMHAAHAASQARSADVVPLPICP